MLIALKGRKTKSSMTSDTTPVSKAIAGLHTAGSVRGLEIYSIFGLGDEVAIFGNFDCPAHSGDERCIGQFSLLASIDREAEQIVCLRWLDQAL